MESCINTTKVPMYHHTSLKPPLAYRTASKVYESSTRSPILAKSCLVGDFTILPNKKSSHSSANKAAVAKHWGREGGGAIYAQSQ